MTSTIPSFRGRTPSDRELDDLILIALAVRDQNNLDVRASPRTGRREAHEPIGNVRAIAEAEGWVVGADRTDAAVQRLTRAHLLVTDRDPGRPEPNGCSARLSAEGYARAAKVARSYLGEPLQGVGRNDTVFEGIGQIQVEFLGQRFVVGCVEGEEDRAIRRAPARSRCRRGAGGSDCRPRPYTSDAYGWHARPRAIEELESGSGAVPASDRVVGLDHNSPDYSAAMEAMEAAIKAVRESNTYREIDPEDQELRLAELEAGSPAID
jgi:hypothetical protein